MRKGEYGPTRYRQLEKLTGKNMRATYFNLQDIVSPKALVVHLMVRIVCITATLILNKGKSICYVSDLIRSQRGGPNTHNLLAALRGAGMSQRTRRP